MSSLFDVGLTMVIISFVCLMISIGLWTYADAKVKSDNAAMWTIIALISFPMGFVIYFLAGRQKPEKAPKKYQKLLVFCIIFFFLSFVLYFVGYAQLVISSWFEIRH